MKKKMLCIIATIAAFALFVPSVMAAATPKLEVIGGKKILFANGTPITIEALTEGEGALVKWGDTEEEKIEVTADTTIIGGMHNDDTKVDTMITMNGGTVKHIFAGGLHKSNVGISDVTLNGGTVTGSIMGGGYAGYVNDDDFSTNTYNPTNVKTESIVRVEEAYVRINGGTIGGDVFGGGGGYSYTGSVTIYVEDSFVGEIGYLSGSGSNGYTESIFVVVNGGTIEVLQAVNRGYAESSILTVQGGTVTNAYVSSEGDGSELGVEGEASLYIGGGTVANVAVGVVPTTTNKSTEIKVEYVEGSVTNFNDDISEENITLNVCLTIVTEFDGEIYNDVYFVPKNGVLSEEDKELLEGTITSLEEIAKENKLNYVIKGYYLDEKGTEKADYDKTFDKDTSWYLICDEIIEGGQGTPGGEVKEELPPKTGDLNLILLIGTIVFGVIGTAIVSKKRFANSN